MRLVWLDKALDDLDAIRAYIARDDPAAATRTAERIFARVNRLPAQPNSGRPGRVRGTRELVVAGTPYIVPYRVRPGQIDVLRVLHGARRWPKRF